MRAARWYVVGPIPRMNGEPVDQGLITAGNCDDVGRCSVPMRRVGTAGATDLAGGGKADGLVVVAGCHPHRVLGPGGTDASVDGGVVAGGADLNICGPSRQGHDDYSERSHKPTGVGVLDKGQTEHEGRVAPKLGRRLLDLGLAGITKWLMAPIRLRLEASTSGEILLSAALPPETGCAAGVVDSIVCVAPLARIVYASWGRVNGARAEWGLMTRDRYCACAPSADELVCRALRGRW